MTPLALLFGYHRICFRVFLLELDTIVSHGADCMNKLSLLSTADLQVAFSQSIRDKRKELKLSRAALAERSTVPASTIKKFETTGQISLRQFLLLWQCVDDLRRLHAVTTQGKSAAGRAPTSIDEVLAQ
jgi:hypothetical protein